MSRAAWIPAAWIPAAWIPAAWIPAAWILVALLLTWPIALAPAATLLGDPAIDVWNHAWGYWYVADALGDGRLPWRTALVGGPAGGVLYFIDTPGALAMAPVAWLFGPAVAYNLALILRVALAGLSAQLLATEVLGRGPHSVVAGIAYATTPFLLAELANGIGEVCAVQWLGFTLWAAARALRRGRWSDWALVGLFQGITGVVAFYYGLASAIAVGVLLLAQGLARWRQGARPDVLVLGKLGLAGACALVLVLPHWLAFRASLGASDALVQRSEGLNRQLMAHNAVDPRVFFLPGDFQSVDLAGIYGEPFLHTAYLRWSLLLLALVGLVGWPRLRPWALVMLASMVAALGPYLWWDGAWVEVGGMVLSLPFEWIRQLMPQVAITHPLRLGLAAQAVGSLLAAGGVAVLLRGRSPRAGLALSVLCGALVVGEGLFLSAARWPLPTSSAAVPSVYVDPPPGMVLDLPAEVGTTMETSRYFWYQTVHGRPIPYTPDARMGSARDQVVFSSFSPGPATGRVRRETPRTPSAEVVEHLRQRYGLIVLHTELEARAELASDYESALTPALGPPERHGPLRVWRPGLGATLPR